DLGLGVGGPQVVVVGDDVQLRCPAPVVQRLDAEVHHEVGGGRGGGCGFPEHVPFRLVQRQQGVGAEAAPVQLVGGVGDRAGRAGRQDLVPVVVPLAPEI